ncbi:hypothetical protein D9M69_669620 [compost metagenome]
MGGYLVSLELQQGAEILVRRRAVVALQEVINHVLPVRFDIEGQAAGQSQLGDIRSEFVDFLGQISALLGKGFGIAVQIHIDEAA